jgi:hypothetical protein
VEDRIQRYQNDLTMGQKRDDPNSGAPREQVVAATGKDYFGANLVGSISNGSLTYNVRYKVAFLGEGASAKYFFNRSSAMDPKTGAFTAIGAEAKRVSGGVAVDIAITVYVNSTKYPTQASVPLHTQYAEYQHIEDYVAGIRSAFQPAADSYARGGMGTDPTYILWQLEGQLSTANRETVNRYDRSDSSGNLGQHEAGGTVLRPSDFTGYPSPWW